MRTVIHLIITYFSGFGESLVAIIEPYVNLIEDTFHEPTLEIVAKCAFNKNTPKLVENYTKYLDNAKTEMVGNVVDISNVDWKKISRQSCSSNAVAKNVVLFFLDTLQGCLKKKLSSKESTKAKKEFHKKLCSTIEKL